jgi:hypothetical protein
VISGNKRYMTKYLASAMACPQDVLRTKPPLKRQRREAPVAFALHDALWAAAELANRADAPKSADFCTLFAEDGSAFRVHAVVLREVSEFAGRALAEAGAAAALHLPLPGAPELAEFARFAYQKPAPGELPLRSAMAFLPVFDYLGMRAAIEACDITMAEAASPRNVGELCELARRFNAPETEKAAVRLVSEGMDDADLERAMEACPHIRVIRDVVSKTPKHARAGRARRAEPEPEEEEEEEEEGGEGEEEEEEEDEGDEED